MAKLKASDNFTISMCLFYVVFRPRERLRSIMMSMSVCVSVCPRGYPRDHTLDRYQFLCTLPMTLARLSSGTLTIDRIA